jgi:predicted Zn-dependent protease
MSATPSALRACLGLLALLWLAACNSLDAGGPAAPATPVAQSAPQPEARDVEERRRLVSAFGGTVHNAALEDYLDGVLRKLAGASDQPGAPYRVTILNSPIVNAFALPSGDIYVTRGLLALADDEAEIAAVMAHEIGHVTAHHAAQRAELERTALLFRRVSKQVLSTPDQGQDEAQRMNLSIAKFSRDQEFEADKIGIKVIAHAGYDPYAASRFLAALQRWSQRRTVPGAGGSNTLDMTATHPSTAERVQVAATEARAFGAPGVGAVERDRYLQAIDNIAYGDDPEQGLVIGRQFLHAKLGFAFTAPESFTLENQTVALIGVSADGAEALRLDSVSAESDVTPEASLTKGWIDGVDTKDVQPLKLGDLAAATGTATGEAWSFRLGAVRLGSRMFRLVFAARTLTPAVDKVFLESLNSFHRIEPGEAAAAVGARVHVAAATPGETSQTFAGRMTVSNDALAEFLVLNGLDQGGPVVDGQFYKYAAP